MFILFLFRQTKALAQRRIGSDTGILLATLLLNDERRMLYTRSRKTEFCLPLVVHLRDPLSSYFLLRVFVSV